MTLYQYCLLCNACVNLIFVSVAVLEDIGCTDTLRLIGAQMGLGFGNERAVKLHQYLPHLGAACPHWQHETSQYL